MYLQRVLETMSTGHVRVSVVGNVDAGKSTLIGTLTSSTLDNGKGSNRAKIMKHKHEAETGRTSSITSHLMGFDENGDAIASRQGDADIIARKAQRIVSLMDLAGHCWTVERNGRLRFGIGQRCAATRQPPTHMTMHHRGLSTACGIPVVVVIT
jgi:elongation factor 1-alpha